MSMEPLNFNIKMEKCDEKRLRELLGEENVELVFSKKRGYTNFYESGSEEYMRQIKKVKTNPNNSDLAVLQDERENIEIIPCAENVDFIDNGKVVVKVMDKHNFYEAENLSTEYLTEAPIGLLTKLWIHISKLSKE